MITNQNDTSGHSGQKILWAIRAGITTFVVLSLGLTGWMSYRAGFSAGGRDWMDKMATRLYFEGYNAGVSDPAGTPMDIAEVEAMVAERRAQKQTQPK